MLSEESADDPSRRGRHRLWIVDPLDGTRDFLAGVPHWSVAIALVEDGVAVAGGVYNVPKDELYLGAREIGTTLDGVEVHASRRAALEGAVVLVSRWALGRRRALLAGAPFTLRPVGGLAYTLALIAAGRADATWTRGAKAEWDVAAGAVLVAAAGGRITTWEGREPRFNASPPRLPGLVASGPALFPELRRFLASR